MLIKVIILSLCAELYFFDMMDPKIEKVFGVLNKLLRCKDFKQQFYVDFLIAAASENAEMMEKGCLLGRTMSLSLLVKDDFSDAKRVQSKIEEKIKMCKSKSAYEKTLQNLHMFQANHTNKIVSLVKSLMKKDTEIVDDINSSLYECWESKKMFFKKQNLELKDLFESCSEMVMYYFRAVVIFNVKKTSLA
jgi:hypothetical protein